MVPCAYSNYHCNILNYYSFSLPYTLTSDLEIHRIFFEEEKNILGMFLVSENKMSNFQNESIFPKLQNKGYFQ